MVETMNLAALIREIGRGPSGARDLPEQAAFELYSAMLDGLVPDLELGAIQIALRVKGEGPEEMAGFHRALQSRVARLDPPRVSARPVVLPSYNGARRQANLTPLLALLLNRCGVPVLIHGAPDAHGRVTTEAVLAALDIAPCRDLAEAEARLDGEAIAYAPIELLSPGLAPLLATRKRIGLRSSAHSLAKLIDPFGGEGTARGIRFTSRLPPAHGAVPAALPAPGRCSCAAPRASRSQTPSGGRASSSSTMARQRSCARPSGPDCLTARPSHRHRPRLYGEMDATRPGR